MFAAARNRTKTPLLQTRPLSYYRHRLFSTSIATTCPSVTRSRPVPASLFDKSTRAFALTRHFQSSLPSKMEPIFAEGVSQDSISTTLQSLIEKEQWTLDEERMGIVKTYYFKTYTKCLDFTQVVGIRSKSKNHHPTIIVKSGSVHVHWTTHFPRGLTEKDTDMAQFCDQQAALIGTVAQVEANKCKPTTKS